MTWSEIVIETLCWGWIDGVKKSLDEHAYAPASQMQVPADSLVELEKRPKAKQFYEQLTKANRYAIAYGLETAKKPETRQRRFEKFMDMLIREERPGFGFKNRT